MMATDMLKIAAFAILELLLQYDLLNLSSDFLARKLEQHYTLL